MISLRFVASLALVVSLASCAEMGMQKKESASAKKKKEAAAKDLAGDVAFQAFLGRLRKAAAARDIPVIASMMTQDFAYVLGATPADDRTGEGVFQYWDENGLWPELRAVLGEKFAPKGTFMVAPPQFAMNPESYHGYRAGITLINGSWKFAYFVRD